MKHLIKRNTSSLIGELKDVVAWFTGFGWTTKIISLNGEEAISKASVEIMSLGIEVVVYPTDSCDPIAEAKIRRIKDQARNMLSYIRMKHDWEINSRLLPWLGVAAAARTITRVQIRCHQSPLSRKCYSTTVATALLHLESVLR